MYVCVYACMCVCVYVCMYMYVCMRPYPAHNCLELWKRFCGNGEFGKLGFVLQEGDRGTRVRGLECNLLGRVGWVDSRCLAACDDGAHLCHEPFRRVEAKDVGRTVLLHPDGHQCLCDLARFVVVLLPRPRGPFRVRECWWRYLADQPRAWPSVVAVKP